MTLCDDAYMVCFLHNYLHKDKEKNKETSLFDKCHLFYDVIMIPSKMHKIHIMWLWMRIPIVLGSHMVRDCYFLWYQESLTNDYELMVL